MTFWLVDITICCARLKLLEHKIPFITLDALIELTALQPAKPSWMPKLTSALIEPSIRTDWAPRIWNYCAGYMWPGPCTCCIRRVPCTDRSWCPFARWFCRSLAVWDCRMDRSSAGTVAAKNKLKVSTRSTAAYVHYQTCPSCTKGWCSRICCCCCISRFSAWMRMASFSWAASSGCKRDERWVRKIVL